MWPEIIAWKNNDFITIPEHIYRTLENSSKTEEQIKKIIQDFK